ncbi:MAG: FlgD immunoglobulin-like domain containing protein [bacterium]
MIKRLLSISIFCLWAGAASQVWSQLDLSPPAMINLSTLNDTTVAIPLNLQNPDSNAIKAFGLRIIYPTQLLTFKHTDNANTLTDGWITAKGQENEPGVIVVGGFNTTAITASGVLMKVVFAVTGTVGSDTLKLTNFADDLAEATTTDGAVFHLFTSVENAPETPGQFALLPNYPNPFNPRTTIRYFLPRTAQVELKIFNMVGQPIRTLVEAEQPAGLQSVVWDGKNDRGEGVSSGAYFYKIVADDFTKIRRLLFLK